MNYYDHASLSVRKFGGKEVDYIHIHAFMDCSKFFYHHAKHRLLLHQLYGVNLAIKKFGHYIQNSDNTTILVRDIAVEHCKEDLSGVVPTINDWLEANDELLSRSIFVPQISDPALKDFIHAPYLMSGLRSALLITCSNFGVYLTQLFLGIEKATILLESLPSEATAQHYLKAFNYSASWQFTPDMNELNWLKAHKKEQRSTINKPKNI